MSRGFRIALMCAEKEPVECHRTILVAWHLANREIEIQHIIATGELESQEDALRRLARAAKAPENDLFRSAEELLAETYRRQEKRIAYDTERAPAFRVAAG